MFQRRKNHFTVVLAAGVVAASACSRSTEPASNPEKDQIAAGYSTELPAPGTYVSRDREGNVLATGSLAHSPETERVSWVFARSLREVAQRPASGIAAYSRPDPECSANVGDSADKLDEFGACTSQPYADAGCSVVVVEYFRESGDLHAHCEDTRT